jgi:long-subunit fatty acid transport protein
MEKLKAMVAAVALLALAGRVTAQNETDALRYSQLKFGGTARIQGIAGAQTALGADASSMHSNPAGLGLYRKSEFSITPGIGFNETESSTGGTSVSDSRNKFFLSQLGLVFSGHKPDEVMGDWRGGSFGVGYTRLNDFNNTTGFVGNIGDKQSWLQSLDDNVKNMGITQADLDAEYGSNGDNITSLEGLAYATFLIDTLPGSNGRLYVPARQGVIKQQETIFSKGSQDEWDFSYGGSYMDKLYVGATLGLTTLRYEQSRTYQEDAGPEEPYFSSLVLSDFFVTRGTGINFKLGLIYKPTDAVRLGASIQTPTYNDMEDSYVSSLTVNYKPGVFAQNTFTARTLDGFFEYDLTTPFRASGGVAAFIGKYGFVSADLEYVDYPNAHYSLSEDNPYGIPSGTSYFQAQNTRISNSYDGSINFRLGTEARFDIFRIRLGYAYYGDPYRNSNLDRSQNYFTGGFGIKEKRFFLDAAYVHNTYDSFYSPYTLNDGSQPIVSTQNTRASFLFTAGFNF